MSEIMIRKTGRAGRATLSRPAAMNALTPGMARALEDALDQWRDDADVDLVIVDAEGERAFCAGGDIVGIYNEGRAGNYAFARDFWRAEYRLNAKMAHYPKPAVAFMQGFTMGGGVGIGCHARHRVLGDSSRIAMPECGIGLVPDVGGSLILGRAPGHLGEYFGTTAARMAAADAILAGFGDHYIPEAQWPTLIDRLEREGDAGIIPQIAQDPGPAPIEAHRALIDRCFGAARLADTVTALQAEDSGLARQTLKALDAVSPLSAAITFDLVRASRAADRIEDALELEYRVTHRLVESGDLIEGIRAQVIDKDRQPNWRHTGIAAVSASDVQAFLAPLGADTLELGDVA